MSTKEIVNFLAGRRMVISTIQQINKNISGPEFNTRILYRLVEREESGVNITPRQALLKQMLTDFISEQQIA